jgi:cytidylate kinase
MIFCIFGGSCVGKTTVAKQIAAELGIPLRSCGSAVSERARPLRMNVRDLPDTIHREVDGCTVAWGLANQPCIIEGRYLDAVFAGVRAPVLLIHLTCSEARRQSRRDSSESSPFAMNSVQQADADDANFRTRMFPAPTETIPCLTIDSSEMTVEECVLCLTEIIEARLPRRA